MDPALGAYLQQLAAGLARALGPADRFAAVVLDRFPEADR
jgi:hypothetical protein